jgi:hypothetical protein
MRMRRRKRRWSFVVSLSLFAVRCSTFAPSWGTPLPHRYIRINTLGRIYRQSLERKGVRGKVLKTKELGFSS